MNLIIHDGAAATRHSIDPDSIEWYKQNPPAEYGFESLGGKKLFVKRQQTRFPGWGLLVSAISDSPVKNTGRVLSICRDKAHYYYFAERLAGDTVEGRKSKSLTGVDFRRGVLALCDALEDINNRGFWFTDLCQKNIFTTPEGFRLIDLDSSLPLSQKVVNDLPVSYDYKVLLDEYASRYEKTFGYKMTDISGTCMNQAETIFFGVDASEAFKIPAAKRKEVVHGILSRPATASVYKQLFSKLIRGQPDWALTRRLVDLIF